METRHSNADRAREALAREMDAGKIATMNRKEVRSRTKFRHTKARVRSGRPTGTTTHFKLWMADLNLKRALQLTKLTTLAGKHNDPVLINSYTLLASSGFKTLWDLTQADARDLLAAKGIGPKKLEHIKADLAARNVAVKW